MADSFFSPAALTGEIDVINKPNTKIIAINHRNPDLYTAQLLLYRLIQEWAWAVDSRPLLQRIIDNLFVPYRE
jgi:hypothetical protein